MTVVRASLATYRGIGTARGLAFLGIPYARPPVGPLRFLPPHPLPPGATVDATRPEAAPPQAETPRPDWMPARTAQRYSEDCLNLNLWTPAADDALRPVIVHVFGGGFQGGTATGGHIDEGAFTSAGDVVLVRPNMRTGALGFLHLAEAFPGIAATNRGLLDLIAALEWVKDNVRAFGGDPGNITLVGLSSGAFTTAALFATPATGLFHKAWMMSGSASRIVAPETAAAIAADVLDRAGIAPGDLAALQSLPADRIVGLQTQVLATDLGERNAPGGRTLGIVLDGTSLPRHPLDAIAAGAARNIPMVLGYTAEEARMWYAAGIMGQADEARLRTTVARFRPDADAALTELRREFPQASPSQLEETFLSRTVYRDPALRTAQAQRQAGGRAWCYEFAWRPSGRFRPLGASHGFDEPFVFGLHAPDAFPPAAADPNAAALTRQLESALFALASTGDPGWAGPIAHRS